uniref:Uncharacterized protein n=1 Tax=Oryza brachyantha TaxID=4533 RepID=J3MBJ0_ORYBR
MALGGDNEEDRPVPFPRICEKVNGQWEVCVSPCEGQFEQLLAAVLSATCFFVPVKGVFGWWDMSGWEMTVQVFDVFGLWAKLDMVVQKGNIPRRCWMGVSGQIGRISSSTFTNQDH